MPAVLAAFLIPESAIEPLRLLITGGVLTFMTGVTVLIVIDACKQ